MRSFSFDGLVVSDRDIFDILESQKLTISDSKLVSFLKERGVLCSSKDSRLKLIQYISSQNIDWYFIEDILSLAESSDRNQKVTSVSLGLKDKAALKNTLEDLKTSLAHKNFTVDEKSTGYDISYITETIEKSNSRLIQRKSKDESISIKVENGSITIVSTSGEDTQPTVSKIIETIEQKTKSVLEKKSVDFSNIQSSESINNFFLELIKFNAKKYTIADVIKLKLNKFNSKEEHEVDLELIDIDEDEDEDSEVPSDDNSPPPILNNSTKKRVHLDESTIKSALISGSSLLTSKVFASFTEQGYFISAITWVLLEKNSEKMKVELFAGFSDPDNRKSFTYEFKCFYKFNSKTGVHNKGKQKFKSSQKSSLELDFHNASLKLYEAAISKLLHKS